MRNCAVFWLGRVLFFCCQFFGCFFRLATCKLLDDRPQMALSTGMFQLKKVWGWDELINSILSCAHITQVLLLSKYQLFNFHHDWGGRSGERGWNSTFGKSPFRAGGGQGLVWCHMFFLLGGGEVKGRVLKRWSLQKKTSCFCCCFTVIWSPGCRIRSRSLSSSSEALDLMAPPTSLQVASIQATSSGTDAVPVLSLVNGSFYKKCLTYIKSGMLIHEGWSRDIWRNLL